MEHSEMCPPLAMIICDATTLSASPFPPFPQMISVPRQTGRRVTCIPQCNLTIFNHSPHFSASPEHFAPIFSRTERFRVLVNILGDESHTHSTQTDAHSQAERKGTPVAILEMSKCVQMENMRARHSPGPVCYHSVARLEYVCGDHFFLYAP